MGYLSGWPYYKVISLTGQTGAGTLYQVDLDIGASAGGDFHLENHCTNFPQDVEVTDNDGTTLLDFWIEDIAADPIKMHVEVADDLGSNQSIWIYYGKSGATTSSNGPNTFLQWHGAATASFLDSLSVSPTNIAYEGKLKRSGSSNILWGLSKDSGWATEMLALQSYTEGNLRYVYARNNGSTTAKNESPAFPDGTWVRGKITNDGTTVYGYVDGNEISTGGLTTNIPDENMGLGFLEASGSAEQAWSFARKWVSPEPAFSSAGAEQSAPGVGNPYWYYRLLKERN